MQCIKLNTDTGVNFGIEAVQKLIDSQKVEFGTFAIVATVISIILKELMARYSIFAGKKTGSASLKADGWHHRSDAISSVVILVGIFLGDLFWWIDGVLGFIVSIFILYTAYDISKESVSFLLGEQYDRDLEDKLGKICLESGLGDVELHHIHLHHYGKHQELTCHIKLDRNMLLHEAHSVATQLEVKIKEQLGIVATIHTEPKNSSHAKPTTK